MTMPQPTVLDTTTDLRPATLARLKTELETALRSHEERLVQDPEQDDISMTVYRRSQEAHDEIVAALSRMSEGTYGICETCGGAISEDRLEVMPHTRLCMSCAHRAR
ncbi:MAG: TraR/DksA C4-type zinc finger protein [Acidimicrobiia bacterium]|nr:TraR/DksA C4-type zinc finger protein [Acidimicrobiia bacterium]